MKWQDLSPRTLIVAALSLGFIAIVLIMGSGRGDGAPNADGTATHQPADTADEHADNGDGDGEGQDSGHSHDRGEEPTPQPTETTPEPEVPTDLPTPMGTPGGTEPPPEPWDPGEESTRDPTLPPGVERDGPDAPPSLGDVDGNDPIAVAKAALVTAYTVDTARSADAEAAVAAVHPWLTTPDDKEEYDLDDLVDEFEDAWDTWVDHQAYVQVNYIDHGLDQGAPETTPTQSYIQLSVSATPLGRDGWTGKAETQIWYVELGRASAEEPWRVAALLRV